MWSMYWDNKMEVRKKNKNNIGMPFLKALLTHLYNQSRTLPG